MRCVFEERYVGHEPVEVAAHLITISNGINSRDFFRIVFLSAAVWTQKQNL